jgi:hypothetical protein
MDERWSHCVAHARCGLTTLKLDLFTRRQSPYQCVESVTNAMSWSAPMARVVSSSSALYRTVGA